MKKRKGYTLAETVIAMALALLVMIAATSVSLTTLQTSRRLNMGRIVVQEMENILICYQNGPPKQGLDLLYGADMAEEKDGKMVVYFDGANKVLKADDSTEDAVWMVECYHAGNTLKLRAIEIASGEVLYDEINYTLR